MFPLLLIGATATNPVLLGLAIYGCARIVLDLTRPHTTADDAAKAAKTVVEAVVNAAETAKPDPAVNAIALDFEELERLYRDAGELGVYAHLIDNGVAKDWHHGQYIIQHVFLPELARRQAHNDQEDA